MSDCATWPLTLPRLTDLRVTWARVTTGLAEGMQGRGELKPKRLTPPEHLTSPRF